VDFRVNKTLKGFIKKDSSGVYKTLDTENPLCTEAGVVRFTETPLGSVLSRPRKGKAIPKNKRVTNYWVSFT